MLPDFAPQLRAYAEVIVRVGLNLQPGQPLLITDPYELQGVHPESAALVEAVRAAAPGHEVTSIPADLLRLRELADTDNLRGFEALVYTHCRRMQRHLDEGGAFLFPLGNQSQLLAGLPAERLDRFNRGKWRLIGPLIQQLVRGATQWTLCPAPSSAWADSVYSDLPEADRLAALWRTVFASLRLAGSDPVSAWQTHLALLARQRGNLEAAHHRKIRYVGPGTDLTFALPRSHQWCTAQLKTKGGISFVANLPTEEIFTAPHKHSANGRLRVARPVLHSSSLIDGIELEFQGGRVVQARASAGLDALQYLLVTDPGASRIGEVALVPEANTLTRDRRLFHHSLLDENAAPHVALGEAYRFCSGALLPLALNSSQIHVDLPLDAEVTFPD